MEKPEQIPEEKINLTALKEICQQYIDYVDSDEFHEDNDYDYYVFEVAMTTLFGDNIFSFINSKIK